MRRGLLCTATPRLFYFTYWLTDAGYALLGTLAMYEVLRRARRTLAGAWWTHLIFPAVVAIGVGLSLAHVHYTPPRVSGLLYNVVVFEIAVRFAQVLLFIGLAGFFWLSSFRWSPCVLGISAGFGLYSRGCPADHDQTFGYWNQIHFFVGSDFACSILFGRIDLDLLVQHAPKSLSLARACMNAALIQPHLRNGNHSGASTNSLTFCLR
jgi:hypothetical protein